MAERETTTPRGMAELARIEVVLKEDGTFRAELQDREFVTRSLDELMETVRALLETIRAAVQSPTTGDAAIESPEPEEEDDGVGFEDDMDYVLTKNAELYRRFAMKYLAVRHILQLHERIIQTSGGDPAVLDVDKIDSAAAQPRMTFGGRSLYPTLADKAAALAFSLNMNHPFQDGNKRTSHAAMEMFLVRNGHELDATVDAQEAIFLGVAAGEITREVFTAWVKAHVVRRGWRRPAQSQVSGESSSTPDVEKPLRIVMEHSGGPLDGYAPSSDSPDPNVARWVRGQYGMHAEGTIGRAYMGNSLENFEFLREQARQSGFTGGFHMHKYEIVERREEGNTVIVRYEYRGPAE